MKMQYFPKYNANHRFQANNQVKWFTAARQRHRWAFPPQLRNKYWENWHVLSLRIGVLLILSGLILSVCEVVRIIYGPTNRGIRNYDENDNPTFPSGNEALLASLQNDFSFPMRIEKFHFWPWSYAANLFGAVLITAGLAGVISAYRRSYSSIFVFLTLCLLSALFSGYLIGYYAILVNYYINSGMSQSANRPDSMDTSFGLIGTNLAISLASCLLSTFGFIASFMGINAGTRKGIRFQPIKIRNI